MSLSHERYGNKPINRRGALRPLKIGHFAKVSHYESLRRQTDQQWCKAVRQNPRIPSFNNVPLDECNKRAVFFYKNLIKMYFSEKSYMDHQQAVETINKTIRIFDHGIYIITQKYGELEKQ